MSRTIKTRCCNCGYEQSGCPPGPQPDCPKCGSLYIEWVDYEEGYPWNVEDKKRVKKKRR
jgi:anaerobic ribonucleoside-triphosphate reductase